MLMRPPRRVRVMATFVSSRPRRRLSSCWRSSCLTPLGRGGLSPPASDKLLGLADGQLALEHDGECSNLELGHGESGEGAGVALGDLALQQSLLGLGRKVEQPERIAHRCPRPPDAGSDGFVRHPESLDQEPESEGLFERVEIGALEVLDERQLDHLLLGGLTHDAGIWDRPAIGPPGRDARRR